MDALGVKYFEDRCGLSGANKTDRSSSVFGSYVQGGEIFQSSERNTNTANSERITPTPTDGFKY